jgi:RNA polymerase sigma factor (sigma-70 family)
LELGLSKVTLITSSGFVTSCENPKGADNITDTKNAPKISFVYFILIPLIVFIQGHTRVGREQDTQLGDLIEDGHATPEQTLTHDELHNDLEDLLDELTSREAAVLRRRFGLEDDTPQTLAQIGEELKLSRERVRQIETRALLKLRQPQRRSKVRDYIQGLDS